MLGYEMRYEAEQAEGDGIIVNSKAVPKGDKRAESIELDIKMAQNNGKWLVVDIIPEGASLVETYRNQFTRILDKDGYPGLKAKMEKKLAEPSE
jgi:phospholipid transport system substrate-binding protein